MDWMFDPGQIRHPFIDNFEVQAGVIRCTCAKVKRLVALLGMPGERVVFVNVVFRVEKIRCLSMLMSEK